MVKTVTLELSEEAYGRLERLAQKLGTSPEQAAREALPVYEKIADFYQANPHGNLFHECEHGYSVLLTFEGGSALARYVRKERREEAAEAKECIPGTAVESLNLSKCYAAADKK